MKEDSMLKGLLGAVGVLAASGIIGGVVVYGDVGRLEERVEDNEEALEEQAPVLVDAAKVSISFEHFEKQYDKDQERLEKSLDKILEKLEDEG